MQLSDKQKEFWNEPYHRWNIKHGATRSGKTYMDYFVIPRSIRERVGEPGSIVLLGNTKGTLQRNVIEPMQNIYGTELVSSIKSDNTARLFGERVHCLGADNVKHVDRLRGMSIKYCYGDEVATWNKGVFDMLKSRLDREYSRFDGTCNPQGPDHWFKQFLDSDADIFQQQYSIYDNPFLPKTVLESLEREHKGIFFDRYILGKWVAAEGLVYPMFGQQCIAKTEPREYTKFVISMDYGIQNATAMILWGLSGNVWYAVKEFYHSGRETNRQKTDMQYYEDLLALAGDLPIYRVIIDPSAASFLALIEQKRQFRVWDADNSVIEGIQHTAQCLADGKIKINDCCTRTIQEFGVYAWEENSAEDRPMKVNDHAMDAVRYFVQTMQIYRERRAGGIIYF